MEETKLDKAVDKLFRFIEKYSNRLINTARNSSPYFGYVIIFVYISYIILCLIDIYYHGWKFKLPDGAVNIDFILRLLMIFFVYPIQVYFSNRNLFRDFDSKLLKISSKFFVEKIVNDCFKPIIADWREEYFSAINENRKWQGFLINCRYTYAFILAMVQQSSMRRVFKLGHD